MDTPDSMPEPVFAPPPLPSNDTYTNNYGSGSGLATTWHSTVGDLLTFTQSYRLLFRTINLTEMMIGPALELAAYNHSLPDGNLLLVGTLDGKVCCVLISVVCI